MTLSDGPNFRSPAGSASNFRSSAGSASGRPGTGWGRILLIVAVVAVAGLAIRWVSSGGSSDGQPIFRTAAVERRQIIATVEATGRLVPREPVLVLAPVNGRLAEVFVTARQVVKKGDRLARLDAASLAFEVRRAEAGVAAARGALAEARSGAVEADQQRARAEKLASRGQLSQADRQAAVGASERAKAAVRVAAAKLKEAQASLRAARFATEQTDIVAPKDGVVLAVPRELGLAVSPAGPVLFTLSASLDVLRLEAAVGEADIGKLAVGRPAEFEVQAYSDRAFKAKVEAIGVVANTGKGAATYTVQLTAPNVDDRLLPGMSAAVRFEVARATDVLAVRDAALRFRPAGIDEAPPRSRVFKVLQNGRVEIVAVEIGIDDGVWAEVKTTKSGGLAPGDTLAVGYLSGRSRATPNLKIGG